jgi:putative ABC transport system permease protein
MRWCGLSIPERYRAQIEKVPGVAAVTPLTFYGGTYIETGLCAVFRLTSVRCLSRLSIAAEEKQAFIKDPAGAVVGRRKADKHGWKIGDRISLKVRSCRLI